MIIDVNKQRIDSELVELFIIGDAYFTTFASTVTFRDNESPYTLRTYLSLPIELTGIEMKSDGAYSRPKLTVANVLSTFSDTIGVTANDLIGVKVVRRKTLHKYLISGSVQNPPTEGPIQSYIIDRKESENALSITFELASPFDLAGIKIPGRYIIPNTCGWTFQGGAADTTNSRVGGCTWRISSNNNGVAVYLDSRNNLFITGISPPTHNQVASFTKDYIYAISGDKIRINVNGSTSSVSRPEYYQAYASSAGQLTRATGRRCIPYTTYNSGTTYYVYRDGYLFNDYVLYNGHIWRCLKSNVNKIPKGGDFWVRADVCGKKLTSCAQRFGSMATSVQFSNIPSVTQDSSKVLPYGGFPASRRYNR